MNRILFIMIGLSITLASCNKEPSVAFSASATEVTAGDNINFTNESDDNSYRVSWNFGDGGHAETWDASHVFQTEGNYRVTLTATSRRGNKKSTVFKDIIVNERPGEVEDVEPDFAEKMVGVWTLNAASYTQYECSQQNTNTIYDNANTRKFRFNLVSVNTGYYITHNGEQNRFNVTLLNEITADVTSFSAPLGSGIIYFPSGLYQITLDDSQFTFTRTEESYDSFNQCWDRETYTFVLNK